MTNDYTTGNLWSTTLPSWQRDYYSLLLMETLRMKSILVPYTVKKTDFNGANSGTVIFTEVYDTDPNINALAETDIWMRGAYLDSRTISIGLEIHGDVLKFSDYSEIVQYVKRGDLTGLVREKIAQNQVDYLDLLARNAFLKHPHKMYSGTGNTARVGLASGDLFDPDITEVIRVHLEENDIPGVFATGDGDGQTIVCVTTPRVLKDIRTAPGSKWLEVQEYAGAVRKFNSEVGSWAGVRFVKTNRNRLWNTGVITTQTTLDGATVPGQGAASTVDSVYKPGQSSSTRYITLASVSGLAAGQYITISDVSLNGGAGNPPLEDDGTAETRRIVSIDIGNKRVALNKPLLKPHANGDLVTNGLDVHASFFMGGPGIVYGVGEEPNVIVPPTYDDLMMVNRYGWRGFLKFQLFRPEYFEVVESAGSTD